MNFFHRFFNPHCPHCIEERVCKACEVLKYEVERLRADNDRLLGKFLEKPEVIVDRTVAPEPISLPPRINTWAVKRQMLEAEDRERAKILSKAPQPSITELEDELLKAEINREAKRS